MARWCGFYGAVVRPDLWKPNLSDVTQHYRRRFEEDIQHQMTVAQRLNYLLEASSYTKAMVDRLMLARDEPKYTAREWANRLAQTREQDCRAALPLLRPATPVFAEEARLNEPAIDVYVTNIAAMAEASAQRGIAFVHVLQPQALTKTKRYPCERHAIERDNFLYRNYTAATLASYAAARTRLDKLKAQRTGKVLFADLSRFTDDIDQYLYDDTMHAWRHGDLPNIMGAEIARLVVPLTR